MVRAGILIAALTGASLLSGAPAGAGTGVSIDVGRIRVSDELSPGGEYRLPAFGIRNPGAERTTYHLGVWYVDGQTGKQPPADWFRFAPSTITLAGGEVRAVSTLVELPPGARAGDYSALVGAQIVPEEGGVHLGARAAARLTFTVRQSSVLGGWWERLTRFASENAPWTWLLPVTLLTTLLARYVRRRYSFSVARRT